MIVMKFGGTSVQDAKAIDQAASIVKGRLPDKPVVVVSAMAKVTDQLLAMARAAGSGDRETAIQLSRALRERHYNTTGELLGTGVFTKFHSELEAAFEALDELLRGIAAVGELTPRTTDYVAAFGETLSSKIVTEAFLARGLDAVLVDSRECIVTDTAHMRAAPLFEETNEETLEAAGGRGESPGDGRLHWSDEDKCHDDDWTRRVGLFGVDYWLGAGRGAD